MAGIAWFSPRLNPATVLFATFLMLAWQGFGAGFTANSWQSMIAKIFPPQQHGTFLGLQGSALNVLFSLGAVSSGFILEKLASPLDFALCFLIASGWLVISYIFLTLTKEEAQPPQQVQTNLRSFFTSLGKILEKNRNFGWFLAGRIMTQFSGMASAFYIVYAVKNFQMNESTAGLMTGVLAGSMIIANPILGWLGDRIGHRLMLATGAISASLSALLAVAAPSLSWFYFVFILIGVSNVATWTIAMSITMEFGSDAERPAYIGLANTLIAPGAIVAPLFGGWLADLAGFKTTFGVSAIFGLATALIFLLVMRDPIQKTDANQHTE